MSEEFCIPAALLHDASNEVSAKITLPCATRLEVIAVDSLQSAGATFSVCVPALLTQGVDQLAAVHQLNSEQRFRRARVTWPTVHG